MILQSLTAYYETLAAQGRLDRPGWAGAKISYALQINGEGELEQVILLKHEQERGKKKVLVPREMSLPAPAKRTVGIVANFLWDNASYILGVDDKGKPQRSHKCTISFWMVWIALPPVLCCASSTVGSRKKLRSTPRCK